MMDAIHVLGEATLQGPFDGSATVTRPPPCLDHVPHELRPRLPAGVLLHGASTQRVARRLAAKDLRRNALTNPQRVYPRVRTVTLDQFVQLPLALP